MGEFTWGGKYEGTLPLNLRVSSGVSVFLQLFAIAALLQVSKLFTIGLPETLAKGVVWFFAIFLSLNTIMNAFSKSKKERYVMTPISAVTAICFLIASIGS